jgi:cobalt-zinc-cadmium efflux system outer membrane protein
MTNRLTIALLFTATVVLEAQETNSPAESPVPPDRSMVLRDASSDQSAATVASTPETPPAKPATNITSLAKVDSAAVDTKNELPISFNDFLHAVQESNLSYAAQTYNVSIAQAQISLARLWPHPTISGGYTTPFSQASSVAGVPAGPTSGDQSLPSSATASVSEEIPLGGKLSAKEAVAQTAASQAQAQLEDFFRILRGTAASAYIDALNARLNLVQLQKSYRSLQALSDLNQIRFKDGAIAEVDLLQSRVAALAALSSVRAAESTLRQANIGLSVFMGKRHQTLGLHPLGNLALKLRTFDQESLVADAVAHRTDIIVALRAHENALAQLRVAEANRIPDVTAALNYTHNTQSQNAFAPSPENDQIGFSLQVPLPISDFDTDDRKAAHLTIQQTEKQIESNQAQAETDVRQAVARYRFAVEAAKEYPGGILNDAQRVLDISIYSYKKGNATLLSVRQAESDLTTTYQNYYAALDEEAKALVNLEQMTGFWDVDIQ